MQLNWYLTSILEVALHTVPSNNHTHTQKEQEKCRRRKEKEKSINSEKRQVLKAILLTERVIMLGWEITILDQ